jgi:tetratricopeptide (TPR) repeat protein
VSVSDGYCLWSQRFDREIQDVFAIQDEIARTIADTLNVKLGHSATTTFVRGHNPPVEAYDCYLRGRFHWNKRSRQEFQWALESFQSALGHDPNYAPAYSGIADCHVGAASWGLVPPAEAWPKAKEAAEKALATDNTLAEAHASMGTIRMWYDWDWAKAEQEFLGAIDLNPGDPKAHIQYNLLLVQTGRSEEAEREVRIALSSDPLSVPINLYLAGVFHYRRDYKHSLEQCRKALELDPNDIESQIVLGLNLEQQHLYDDAIRALSRARELSGSNPLICGPLASCYAASGQKSTAMELLDEVNRAAQHTYVAPVTLAMIYLGLREKDLAFQWMEKAAEVHDVLLCYLGVNPIYDFVRDDPRYIALLRRLGLGRLAASLTPTATLM